MNLSIIPNSIWKIVYNYAIDDISDLITFDTTLADFVSFVSFPKELYLAEILYNRIIIACIKYGNDIILGYLMSNMELRNAYHVVNYHRAMSIACEYGYFAIVLIIKQWCLLSREKLKDWLVISLKNLHFEIVSYLYTKGLEIRSLNKSDKIDIVSEALSICDSKDKEKIFDFGNKEWTYITENRFSYP